MRIDTGSTSNRVGIIGCSDIAKIFNLSKYASSYDLYRAYKGLDQEKEFSPEVLESMAMGSFFEDSIARWTEKQYSFKVRKSNLAYIPSQDMAYFVCHPDRIVIGEYKGKHIALEIKFVSEYAKDWGEEDTDQVPDDYLCQVQGYFACGVPCDEVWVMRMKGNRIRRWVIQKDEELVASILKEVKEWHDKVESGWIPDPTTDAGCKVRWDAPVEEVEIATPQDIAMCEERKRLKAQVKELKLKLEGLEVDLKNRIGNKTYLAIETVNGPEKLASWKLQRTNRFNTEKFKGEHIDLYNQYVEVSETRVLR